MLATQVTFCTFCLVSQLVSCALLVTGGTYYAHHKGGKWEVQRGEAGDERQDSNPGKVMIDHYEKMKPTAWPSLTQFVEAPFGSSVIGGLYVWL